MACGPWRSLATLQLYQKHASTQQLQRMAGAGGPAAAARGFGLPVLGGRVVELMRFFFKKIFLAIMQEPLPHPKKLTHLASSIIP